MNLKPIAVLATVALSLTPCAYAGSSTQGESLNGLNANGLNTNGVSIDAVADLRVTSIVLGDGRTFRVR